MMRSIPADRFIIYENYRLALSLKFDFTTDQSSVDNGAVENFLFSASLSLPSRKSRQREREDAFIIKNYSVFDDVVICKRIPYIIVK